MRLFLVIVRYGIVKGHQRRNFLVGLGNAALDIVPERINDVLFIGNIDRLIHEAINLVCSIAGSQIPIPSQFVIA